MDHCEKRHIAQICNYYRQCGKKRLYAETNGLISVYKRRAFKVAHYLISVILTPHSFRSELKKSTLFGELVGNIFIVISR